MSNISTLTPKLRFPEFRKEGAWAIQELGPKTTKVGSGITPTGGEKNYKKSGRPFIRSQNVGWSELLLDDVAYVDDETHSSFDATELRVDDVLLNITGASIGRSALADSRIAGGNVNQHVCIIRVKRDELNPVLLNQYLVSRDGQKQIDSFQAGGNRQGLNFAQIRSFRVPLPPNLAEQQKIADCLSSLDELIELERRKWETLRAYKKGLVQRLFPRDGETTPRLRFPEFRDGGGWETRPLSVIGTNLDNRRIPIAEVNRAKGDIPYYGASGIVDYVKDYIFDEDLLCVSEDGANLVARTYPIAFSISGKTWVNNHAHVLRFDDSHTQRIVEDYLNSIDLRDFITGMAQPKLNRAMLDIIPIPLPPEDEERKQIAGCLSSLDEQITAQAEKLSALQAHKKGLMQQLFPSAAEAEA
jgi:type I restriction enzyme S subunit